MCFGTHVWVTFRCFLKLAWININQFSYPEATSTIIFTWTATICNNRENFYLQAFDLPHRAPNTCISSNWCPSNSKSREVARESQSKFRPHHANAFVARVGGRLRRLPGLRVCRGLQTYSLPAQFTSRAPELAP